MRLLELGLRVEMNCRFLGQMYMPRGEEIVLLVGGGQLYYFYAQNLDGSSGLPSRHAKSSLLSCLHFTL
jgi:hypothetical protein